MSTTSPRMEAIKKRREEQERKRKEEEQKEKLRKQAERKQIEKDLTEQIFKLGINPEIWKDAETASSIINNVKIEEAKDKFSKDDFNHRFAINKFLIILSHYTFMDPNINIKVLNNVDKILTEYTQSITRDWDDIAKKSLEMPELWYKTQNIQKTRQSIFKLLSPRSKK